MINGDHSGGRYRSVVVGIKMLILMVLEFKGKLF